MRCQFVRPHSRCALREHRVKQLELHAALGLGRPVDDTLVFSNLDGSPISPRRAVIWLRTCVALRLPRVNFHALRHTHASRRLGHANPTMTLNIYANPFNPKNIAAADAIERVLRTRKER